jgi:hypothetical protein
MESTNYKKDYYYDNYKGNIMLFTKLMDVQVMIILIKRMGKVNINIKATRRNGMITKKHIL